MSGNYASDDGGAQLSRVKVAPSGWSFHYQGTEFETSRLDSIYNKDEAGDDLGFSTIKLYDAAGDEIVTQGAADTDCVKTVIDWEPTFDYYIIGGALRMPVATTEDIHAYVIGVPDIPAPNGNKFHHMCHSY